MNDDELLVSFFVSKTTSTSTDDVSSSVRRPLRKGVSSKGRPSKPERRPEQTRQKNWPSTRARTILSWLIHSGVVSLNEVIQFQNPEDNAVLKQSIITKNGLLCTCCNKTLSISDFSAHAGLNSKWPCMSLFMEYGKSLILCQLEAWSAEYKEKKSPGEFSQVDEGDDICGKCGLEGELVMCDNCPAAFHQACLSEQFDMDSPHLLSILDFILAVVLLKAARNTYLNKDTIGCFKAQFGVFGSRSLLKKLKLLISENI
ncbi:hypothetical protein MIMGU_mgv11b023546mg [Erythranthe guttata]|uniref:Uncharacterized protein n=1 Tax=Erythranthe guttata TaxID=4155 RepID=A0A022Q2S8_ERYGU|nr:hypothetical protein MIMGU_mgv11b023546mg [Erythranthe guttata]